MALTSFSLWGFGFASTYFKYDASNYGNVAVVSNNREMVNTCPEGHYKVNLNYLSFGTVDRMRDAYLDNYMYPPQCH